MKTPVFRVSEAETFRQWRDDPKVDDVTALLARLRGQSPETEAMAAGTAFHKVLELAAEEQEFETAEANGHGFVFPGDVEITLPAIRELRHSKTYGTSHGDITITGQVDALDGRRIEDHKTTANFNPDRYLSGYQWRLYLDIFDADVFRWNVFVISSRKKLPRAWSVREIHQFEQCRYPTLEADCASLAYGLLLFSKSFMPERFRPPGAA